jgi:predicted DsbA family dithiol-disulfide isomerase
MRENPSIAIFSDVICPWCFLGKRRLERALDQLGMRADLRWLPFELNPEMPPGGMDRAEYRARKFGTDKAAALDSDMKARGAEEGIAFAFEKMARTPNTRPAHLLIAHASRQGLGGDAVEALFRAYFEEGRDIGDPQVLADVAAGVGLESELVRAALTDATLDSAVQSLEEEARRLGIEGVPFFIIDEAWAVSGAQPPEAWLEILGKIPDRRSEVPAG